MTNDPRDPREAVCRNISGFDDYTREYKLTPFRSQVVDVVSPTTEASLKEYRIYSMVAAAGPAGVNLYGNGTVSSSNGYIQIYMKTVAGGSTESYDPTTPWGTARGTSTATMTDAGVGMVLYHNYLYGGNGTSGIWKYGDITTAGGETFTNLDYNLHPATAPGLVHSKDDCLYFPSNNMILRNNNGSWSVALTLPTNCTIASICEHGNYLTIAANQADGTGSVYLWDRSATLNTISEKIDWGVGHLYLIESIGGVLCGISTTANSSTSIDPRVMFKYYSGTRVVTFEELVCAWGSTVTIKGKQTFNNLFYFLAEITTNGTAYKGLWKIFKNPVGNLAVSFDRPPRNDVTINTGTLHGFYRWGDYVFIAYGDPTNSDAYTIWRTDGAGNTFTATAYLETTINPLQAERIRGQSGTRSAKKSLIAVGLASEPLTAGQQLVLKYRVDAGAWVTIFTATYSADPNKSNVAHEATFDSAGKQFRTGREYEFRVESTGGAEPTELKYKIEELETLL